MARRKLNLAADAGKPPAASNTTQHNTNSNQHNIMSQVTEGQLRDIISLKAHRDPNFRAQLKSNPKATVEGILGSSLSGISVSVVEDTDNAITLVIPPAASEELSEDQLEAVAGGFLDATLGSSVLGDGMLCIGGGLINSKMELNL